MFPSCSLVAASVLDLTQTEVPGTCILPRLLTAECPPLDMGPTRLSISGKSSMSWTDTLILRPELCSRMRLTGDVSMLPPGIMEASRCFQFQSCSPHRSHEPHLEQRWSSHSLQRASPAPIPSRSMLSTGQGSHPCWSPDTDSAQHDLQHTMADEPNTTHCGVCKPFVFLAVQCALGKFTVF